MLPYHSSLIISILFLPPVSTQQYHRRRWKSRHFLKQIQLFRRAFSLTTAPQILHFEQGPCNRFECMLYYWQKERWTALSVRCASSRKNRLWPHLWPSTASDYVDTVRVRAHESSDFRLKSIENHPKTLILQGFYGSGRGSRKFESCHLDQNQNGKACLPILILIEISRWKTSQTLAFEGVCDKASIEIRRTITQTQVQNLAFPFWFW